MKLTATRLSILFLSLVVSTASSLASQKCECPSKPDGPGGGVKCEADQMATCDPSKGECNCTCDSVERGRTREQYFAIMLSKAFGESVTTLDLSQRKYKDPIDAFMLSADQGKFRVPKGDVDRFEIVIVSPPRWVLDILKNRQK